ncbi:MAG: DUF998 domain-containing protein [Thermoplasmata archaeon]
MARMGPLVHRSVHYGAFALIASVLAIILGLLLAIFVPGAESTSVTLSQIGSAGGSMWAIALDGGLILGGLLGLLASILIWTAFPARSSRTLGLLALDGSFVGAIGFGACPTGTSWGNSGAHTVFLWIFYVLIVVALLFLALAMLRDTRWSGYRLYTLLSGIVSLAGLLLTYLGAYGAIGPLRAELLILGPWLVWSLVVGSHLARIPTYSPPSATLGA